MCVKFASLALLSGDHTEFRFHPVRLQLWLNQTLNTIIIGEEKLRSIISVRQTVEISYIRLNISFLMIIFQIEVTYKESSVCSRVPMLIKSEIMYILDKLLF